eukprot:11187201-Alexandrium_andersonii.AAC.1
MSRRGPDAPTPTQRAGSAIERVLGGWSRAPRLAPPAVRGRRAQAAPEGRNQNGQHRLKPL